jgi:hypothetical protein
MFDRILWASYKWLINISFSCLGKNAVKNIGIDEIANIAPKRFVQHVKEADNYPRMPSFREKKSIRKIG